MRISTADLFRSGILQMGRLDTRLADVQRQLSSGKRITRASDDPSGAVQALELRGRGAAVEQYARNANAAASRLQQEEGALGDIESALQRVRELAVQAANATQTDDSRASIARELRQISDGLLDGANARDANGEYLFAGLRSASAPFVRDAGGRVAYAGDAGQRRVALSPSRSVAVGDSGSELMTVPRGNGVFAVVAAAGNAGTGTVTQATVADPASVGAESFTIVMTSASGYEVRDAANAVVGTGVYAPGASIDVGGRLIVIEGAPAAGDSFAVGPAGAASIFDVVDELAAALETPATGPFERARLQQSTGDALQNLDQAIGRVLDLRTAVGARLNTIDGQTAANDAQQVQLKDALSRVEDLDYAEAISRFQLQQTALEAARQTYVELGRSSLFDFLR
ncbi:MAG TPA: flagellar hook-associated protein FlgL [Gammaproteobacteria bacterium]|nr:flagellar hook-associated protein FlgL [Gammaproteobacteria bacterium]